MERLIYNANMAYYRHLIAESERDAKRDENRHRMLLTPRMPAYMIALNRSVHDRQKLEAYWKAAGPSFEGRGAKFLSIYTPLAPLELMGSLEIEFPDVAAAKAWYESPAYQGEAAQGRRGRYRVLHH